LKIKLLSLPKNRSKFALEDKLLSLPLGILGSEVASESKWKIVKWTATRTRGGGRYKSQGGIQ
jgi:hypothetical protein